MHLLHKPVFVNYFIIFHMHLHTDEVIYETGLCNKCIYIVSHTNGTQRIASTWKRMPQNITSLVRNTIWPDEDVIPITWQDNVWHDLNITSLSVRWYFELIGTSYAEWPSSDEPLRLSCLSCIQLITVPSPGVVSSEVSEPKSLHEPYMIRAIVSASLVSQIVSHLSAKLDRPDRYGLLIWLDLIDKLAHGSSLFNLSQ